MQCRSHRTPLGIILINALPAFGAMKVIDDADAPISKAGSGHLNQSDIQLGHGMHLIQEVNSCFLKILLM